MKKAGMLNFQHRRSWLNEECLCPPERSFGRMLQRAQVDKVASGQLPAGQNFRVAAEFAATRGTMNVASCCSSATK
jgi:hypothetical protein